MLGLAAMAAVTACSSTQVTSTWKDPAAVAATRFQRVLVIAIVPDESARRNLEEQLAAELRQGGTQAIPSNQLIEDRTALTKESVKGIVEQRGFDSVLVTHYMGTERQFEYVPGTYDAYFGYMSPMIYEPGYLRETTNVRLETRLFDARGGGQLVWSASTSTMDPASAQKAIPEVAEKIAERLRKDVHI